MAQGKTRRRAGRQAAGWGRCLWGSPRVARCGVKGRQPNSWECVAQWGEGKLARAGKVGKNKAQGGKEPTQAGHGGTPTNQQEGGQGSEYPQG